MVAAVGGAPAVDDPPPDLAARNWADLTEPLLVLIVDRLTAVSHVVFSAVCRSWRSAAASVPCRGPPLLLSPAVYRQGWWMGTPKCHLSSPGVNRTYRSPISPKSLRQICVGCSHSHLIFVAGNRAVLANPFTGGEVLSPDFPRGSFYFNFASLSSPLESGSCTLLLVGFNVMTDCVYILFWQPHNGGDQWSERQLKLPKLESVLLFQGKLLCLDSLHSLVEVELEPMMMIHRRRIHESAQCYSINTCLVPSSENFSGRLVECVGELLLLFCPSTEQFWTCDPTNIDIQVYQFDAAGSVWVKKDNLGDWCLFVDAKGVRSCSNPQRWGGRRDCVYVAGPGFKSWSVLSLDGEAVDAHDFSLNPRFASLHSWPSPVWVYPTVHPYILLTGVTPFS